MKAVINLMNKKNIFRITLVLFIISLLPIMALAGYNYPCADDFSASDTVYFAWRDSRSIISVIKAALENVRYNYMEWSGVFASVFWTSLQPGIFGEQYYGITTWITIILLIISVFYFFSVVLEKYLGADKYDVGIIAVSFLFIIIQCMPSGLEGLYWHAGVVNYTWAFAFLLLLTALLLSNKREESKSKRITKLILSVILSILVGGGNFITGLQGCLWLVSILLFDCIGVNKGRVKKLYFTTVVPLVTLLLSFGASVLAPGNSVRMVSSSGFGAVKSILVSFYYVLEIPPEQWISWPILLILLLILPVMSNIVEKCDFSFPLPGTVMGIGFCFTAAGFTPSLYAQGAMEAGRLHNTVYFIWLIMTYIVLLYIVGWFKKNIMDTRKELQENQKEDILTGYVVSIGGLLLAGSILCSAVDSKTYIGTESFQSIVSGQALHYKAENEYRISLLRDPDLKDVEFVRITDPPSLLLFQDLSPDPNEWVNTVTAEYYEKNSVSAY